VKLFALVFVLIVQPWSMAQSAVTKQKFICNTGYTLPQCQREMKALRPILDKYDAEALGEWTWILVRSEDWRPLLHRLGGNPDSPALTFLRERTTIFEEALVEPVPGRRAELLKIWQLPLDHLLDEAVSHELGHSLCNDSNEARAERRARALQRGEKPNCGDTKQSPSKPGIWAAFQP